MQGYLPDLVFAGFVFSLSATCAGLQSSNRNVSQKHAFKHLPWNGGRIQQMQTTWIVFGLQPRLHISGALPLPCRAQLVLSKWHCNTVAYCCSIQATLQTLSWTNCVALDMICTTNALAESSLLLTLAVVMVVYVMCLKNTLHNE